MTEKSINSDRGSVYYWVSKHPDKNAETIVFLPGLTANHHLFDFQISYFSDRFTVLVWDAPAHGKSRPYKEFSYSNLAEELKTILDAENIEQIILVGQSAGGFVSQSFIAKYHDMVKGMLLIGTSPYGTGYYSKSDIFWLKQTKWTPKLYPDKMLRSATAKLCGTTETARKNMLQMLNDYDKKELCNLMYLGFAAFIKEIREINIACPVWLVVGENDRTGKVQKYNAMWHKRKGYPLYIIKDAAHNTNVDKPDEVNKIIEEFIGICKIKK